MRIEDICSANVIGILPSASVREAARQLREAHVGCLVVVECTSGDRVPVGMITDRDIVVSVVAPGIDPDMLTVGDVMARPPITCRDDADLFDVLEQMRDQGVRRMPVVDARGVLTGLLSMDDMIAALGTHLSEISCAMTMERAREFVQRV